MWSACCSNSARDSQLSASDADKSAGVTGPAYYANVDASDDPRSSERGVDLLPDPRHATTSNGYSDSDPGGGGGGAVPVPLRVTKKRRSTKPRADASTSDVDASIGSADLAPGLTSTLRGRGGDDGGPPTSSSKPPAYANLSYEQDTPEGRRHGAPAADKDGKRRGRQRAAPADPIRDPVMRNVAAQQLRVHIKAQPGTAVHITPSSTPPTRPDAPAYHAPAAAAARPYPSGTESETEI